MKRSHFSIAALFVLILSVFLASTPPAQAQSTISQTYPNVTSRPLTVFHADVDSVVTVTTSSFGFSGYDAESFSTYPIAYGKLLTSAGKPKVSVYLDGSFGFDTWTAVDTIMTTDSVTTYGSGTIDLNNKHYPKYRLRIIGTAGNRSDTQLDLGLYAYKKSY